MKDLLDPTTQKDGICSCAGLVMINISVKE